MGFGARHFAHGANAAKPKQLSLPSVIISKIRFFRETKMSWKSYKSRRFKPRRGQASQRRCVCEVRSRNVRQKNVQFCNFVEMLSRDWGGEGQPKAIDERILQLKRESTQKFTKNRKKMWKDEGGKEKKRSKRKDKREEEEQGKHFIHPNSRSPAPGGKILVDSTRAL